MMATSGSAFHCARSAVFRLIVSVVLLVSMVANGVIAHGYMPSNQSGDAYITLCLAKGDVGLSVLRLSDELSPDNIYDSRSHQDLGALACPFGVLSHAGVLVSFPPAVSIVGSLVWRWVLWQQTEVIHPAFITGIPIGSRAPPAF